MSALFPRAKHREDYLFFFPFADGIPAEVVHGVCCLALFHPCSASGSITEQIDADYNLDAHKANKCAVRDLQIGPVMRGHRP